MMMSCHYIYIINIINKTMYQRKMEKYEHNTWCTPKMTRHKHVKANLNTKNSKKGFMDEILIPVMLIYILMLWPSNGRFCRVSSK